MSKKILIVEDDRPIMTVIARIAKTLDRTLIIDTVTNGEEALVLLEKGPYDLIIADCILVGNMSGIELWEHCAVKLPKTPIMLTSGLSVEAFLKFIGTRVCPPFLPKPFYPAECQEMIGRFLYPE